MLTVRIQVSGKVQGVWFRKYTVQKATELQLSGTVQNLETGDVLIHAAGTTDQLAALEQWCWEGSPQSMVMNVITSPVVHTPFPDFRILD